MTHFSITVQPTKNENIVKFVANAFLLQAQSYEFANIEEAQPSSIAQQLFYLPFVKTVYISQNFIAIEKFNIVNWADVQEEVAKSITEYLNSGKEVISKTELSEKNAISIYAESTPNPVVMKFVANKALVSDIYEFKTQDEAAISPLAKALFEFPFVKEVFLSANYVSIAKNDQVEWPEITVEIREFIRNFIENGGSILTDDALNQVNSKPEQNVEKEPLTDIEKEIVSILNEYVKPAVESDGGNIAFDSYNESTQTVRVILQGACSGCPSSTRTLKSGIETMLKEMLNGKVTTVEAING